MREISVATRSGSSGTVRARVVWIGVLLLTLWAGFLSGQQSFPRNQALYVTMRDGVKIAIDVWLPASLEPDQEIPTVLRATRYWRATDTRSDRPEDDRNFGEAERFNNNGYALVLVDARGSGASFGTRPYELSQEEVQDYGEVVDWVVGQPWSNGRVGAWGVSYSGNTAEMLAVTGHPAVKAIAPLFNDFDNFGHLVFPNSLLTVGFLQAWGEAVHNMDMNDICALRDVTGDACAELEQQTSGVKPVDSDHDRQQLAAAIRQHAANTQPYFAALDYDFRDDPFGSAGVRDVGFKRSPAGYLPQIEASGVAMLIRVGWLDAATVNGALGRYTTIDNPQLVKIGPWDHGANNDTDPFKPVATAVSPSRQAQDEELIEFFDQFLKTDTPVTPASRIDYYTMGSGQWNSTQVWPPEGFAPQRWYFAAGSALSRDAPAQATGADSYIVDFGATTGRHNRWFTNGGAGDVTYPDRARADQRLLTYTGSPLSSDVEITGHPLVTLYVASTHSDGAFIAYLEDIAPNGKVTYITEGGLRAVVRRVTEEPPLYTKFGPHRTERRADAWHLIPGEVAELTFDLWATSVLVKKGHRIRVAIAGADQDTFFRYPKEGGTPTITVYRDRLHASHFELPVKAR